MKRKHTTYSYAHLYNGVVTQLQAAEKQEAGSFYHNLSAMVLTAFSVEVYFNHLGPELFPHWDDGVKRGTNVESKFKMIASRLAISSADYDRLHHALRQLVSFRNKVAHAETETSEFSPSGKKSRGQKAQASWERICTHGTAQQFAELGRDLIVTLNRYAGGHEMELYVIGEGNR